MQEFDRVASRGDQKFSAIFAASQARDFRVEFRSLIMPFSNTKGRMSILSWALPAVLTFVLVFGLYNIFSSGPPVPLMLGFESRQSFDDFKEAVRIDTKKFSFLANSFASKSEGRPAFENRVIRINKYAYGAVQGELELHFGIDGLMKSTFYPDDFEKSRLILSDQLGFDVGKETRQRVAGAGVYTGVDGSKRRYITWQDEHLVKKQKEWLARYDHKTKRRTGP